MDASRVQSHNSSLPLVSRLDHVFGIMKYLERKQNVAKLGSKIGSITGAPVVKRQTPQPLDLALKETYFKGSLLNRVAAIERRLFQLCLEMESSSSSSTCTQTCGETFRSHGSKGESSRSFPTFSTNINPYHGHNNQQLSEVNTTEREIQEQPDSEYPKEKPLSTLAQKQLLRKKTKKNRANKDEKSCESEKKKITSNWPYLKLLGCT